MTSLDDSELQSIVYKPYKKYFSNYYYCKSKDGDVVIIEFPKGCNPIKEKKVTEKK